MRASQDDFDEAYLNEYNGAQLLATSIVFIVVSTACLGIRFWARRLQKLPFRLHDLLIILAWMFIVALCINSIIQLQFGVGYHYARVVRDRASYGAHTHQAVDAVFYLFAVTLAKLAVLVLYLQLFPSKTSRYCCYIVAGLVVANLLTNLVLTFTLRRDSCAWISSTQCQRGGSLFAYGSIPNVVTDILMLLIPLPIIIKLHTALDVKIGLVVTFLVASGGMVASLVRFAFFVGYMNNGNDDFTWSATQLMIVTIVEPGTYFFSTCAITCRPVLSRLAQSRIFTKLYSCFRGRKRPITYEEGASDGAYSLRQRPTLLSHRNKDSPNSPPGSTSSQVSVPMDGSDSNIEATLPQTTYITEGTKV